MKKVGIATMTGGQNYGNKLQNYAVQEILEALGYEAYTLSNTTKQGFKSAARKPIPLTQKLRPKYIREYRVTQLNYKYGCKNERDCRGGGLRRAKGALSEYHEAKRSRIEKFERFTKEHLRFDTVSFDSTFFPRESLEDYYAFVCGSDQVWNPYFYTNSMIEFLQFAPEHKRIAFVPSFGISSIPETRAEDYKNWISHIPHLSVREQAGAEIIRKLTGREAMVLLDPTFGLTKEQWSAFAHRPDNAPEGDYVFCYFLGNEVREYSAWIESYAQEHHCRIVEMFDIHSLEYYDIDPCEFVWLLSHAKAVFTDSFHGTAFSINMQVPFLAFKRQEGGASMSSRISTLLSKTGLEGCVFSHQKNWNSTQIDFSASSDIVKTERKKMFDYLEGALSTVGEKGRPFLANRYHCSGCGACASACPVGALTMKADAEGFAYPAIDLDKCIHCGACERVCPADRPKPDAQQEPSACYAYAKDCDVVGRSSSGGIFSLLAKAVIEKDGLVFGAGYDNDFRVRHMAIDSADEIHRLRTSKYVQSDLGNTFSEVKAALEQGRYVLYTGTPCQIAALRRFVGKSCDRLYTADIICHGVPSPLVWKKYLEQVHEGKEIQSISFRDKTYGWNNFAMRVEAKGLKPYIVPAVKDPYERAFLANLILRPSCYQCQYKTLAHFSDLTMADYWGVELVHPELIEQQGVSLVMVHSSKGRALLDMVSHELYIGSTDREKAVSMNHGALHSASSHPKRLQFFAKMSEQPIAPLVKRCLRQPLKKKVRRFIIVNGSRVKKLIRKLRRA